MERPKESDFFKIMGIGVGVYLLSLLPRLLTNLPPDQARMCLVLLLGSGLGVVLHMFSRKQI